ncbi:MAG: tetratricopeptide repeat protein, partial [Candidatus Omnitrophota bacterium]
DRRREQAQAATDEAQKKKREHDIEVYEAEAGISAKQEELALAQRERDGPAVSESEAIEEIDVLKKKSDALDSRLVQGSPPAATTYTLILTAIDTVVNGDKEDETVKEARQFLISITGDNAAEILAKAVAEKRRELEDVEGELGRTKRQQQSDTLRDLQFEIIYNRVGQEEMVSELKVGKLVQLKTIAGMTVNTDELLEFLAKKTADNKAAQIDLLVDVYQNAEDKVLKAAAEEKLLNMLFEIMGLQEKPDMFQGKSKEEIKGMGYALLNEKLSTDEKEYIAQDELLDVIAPVIVEATDKINRKGKSWQEMSVYERTIMLVGRQDTETIGRITQREADRYNAEAITELAKDEYKAKNIFRALWYAELALTVDPDSAEANMYKGKILVDMGRAHDALKSLKKAAEKAPEDEKPLYELRNAYRKTNDNINTGDTDLKLYELYMKRKDYEKAEEVARDAMQARPRLAKAQEALAKALIEQGRDAEATEIIQAVIRDSGDFLLPRDPWFRGGAKKQQRLYGPIITKEDAAALVEDMARIYLDRGKAQEAKDIINRYWKLVKDLPEANTLLAQAYDTLGDKRKAKKFTNRAVLKEGVGIDTTEKLIDQYAKMGDFKNVTKAIDLAQEAGKKDAERKSFWDEKLARLYIARSRITKGRKGKDIEVVSAQLEDLSKALALAEGLEGETRDSVFRIANARANVMNNIVSNLKPVLLVTGRRKKTRKKRIADIAKLKADLLRMEVDSTERKEDRTSDEAGSIIEKLEKLRAEEDILEETKTGIVTQISRAHRMRADLLSGVPERLAEYQIALKLDSANARAHLAMAEIYEENGQLELAAQHLEEAKKDEKLEGDELAVTQRLINVYTNMDEAAKAAELAREARKKRREAKKAVAKAEPAAEKVGSILALADQYLKAETIRDNLASRIEKLSEEAAGVPDDDADTEVVRAKEFLAMDQKEAEEVERDQQQLIRDMVSAIDTRPESARRRLVQQLAKKLGEGDPAKAVARLEQLLSVMDKKMPGYNDVRIELAGIHAREKKTEKAKEILSEVLFTEGVEYDARIRGTVMIAAVYREEGDYRKAAANSLVAAPDIYRSEAMRMLQDDRMKSEVAGGIAELLKDIRENGIDIQKTDRTPDVFIEEVINALGMLGEYSAAEDLVALAAMHSKSRMKDIAGVLGNAEVSAEEKEKIIKALLAQLKTNAGAIDAATAKEMTPAVKAYAEETDSKEAWTVLAHLYDRQGRRVAKFRIRRKAEKVEKDASYYYDRGQRQLKAGKFTKAIESLDKAAKVDSRLAKDAAYKEAVFASRLGEVEKKKVKGTQEEKVRARIDGLKGLMQYAPDEAAKDSLREKLITEYANMLGVYDSESKDVIAKYKTIDELNSARIETLMEIARLNRQLGKLKEAEDRFNEVLAIKKGHRSAELGIEDINIRRASIALAEKDKVELTDENEKEYLARANKEMAQKAEKIADKRTYFQNAISLTPEDTGLYLELASLMRSKGELDAALDALKKGLSAAKDDKVKKEFESMIREIDAIDNAIDSVVDRDIAVQIAALPADMEPEEREDKITAMRARLSERRKESIGLRERLRVFYLASIGEGEELSAEDENKMRQIVEAALVADTTGLGSIAAEGEPVGRIVERGEKLLSQNKLDDLEELLYQASERGITDDRLEALQARRLIAASKAVIAEEEPGWAEEASAREEVIDSQIEMIKASDLKSKALAEYGSYYNFKARRLSGEESPEAISSAEDQYRAALENNPFSLEALKGLSSIRGTESEVALHARDNILGSKELAEKDNNYKTELIAFLSEKQDSWNSVGAGFKLSSEMVDNFGDISPEAAARLLDMTFSQGLRTSVQTALNKAKKYETPSEYMVVLRRLNKALASMEAEGLARYSDLLLPEPAFTANKQMNSRMALARAYVNMGDGDFAEAEREIKAAEEASAYSRAEASLARARLRVARGEGFMIPGSWWLATRKLSPEAKTEANRSRAQQYVRRASEEGVSDRKKISLLRAAISFDPDNTEIMSELKELYDKTGQFSRALQEATSLMETMLSKGDYEDARDYYLANIERSSFGKDYSARKLTEQRQELAKLNDRARLYLRGTPPKPAAVAPGIMMAVVNADKDRLEELNDRYADVQFVSIQEGGQAGMDALKGMAGPSMRFLADMSETDLTGENLEKIIIQAQRQSFVAMYPYLAGLDAASISKLNDTSIQDSMEIIRLSLDEERAPLSEDVMESLFGTEVTPDRTIAANITPENTEAWARNNIEALKEYDKARSEGLPAEGPAAKLLALRERLMGFFTDKSPEEAGNIMAKHQGIAMAQAAEDKAIELLGMFRSAKAIGEQAIAIDARKETGFKLEYMMPAILNLAEKDPNLKICVIATDEQLTPLIPVTGLPKNVIQLDAVGDDISKSVQDRLLQAGIKIPPAAVTIATGEFMTDTIVTDVNQNRGESANFVIAGEEMMVPDDEATHRINRMIPVLAVMNLLQRVTNEDQPAITTMGFTGTVLDKIMSLKNFIQLVKITRLNIGEEIREQINAITQTAVSL